MYLSMELASRVLGRRSLCDTRKSYTLSRITQALAFERLGISFCLLESRDSLTSGEGASIGPLPNGLRIFDQLGLFEDIENHAAAMKTWRCVDTHGHLLCSIQALAHYSSKSAVYASS